MMFFLIMIVIGDKIVRCDRFCEKEKDCYKRIVENDRTQNERIVVVDDEIGR